MIKISNRVMSHLWILTFPVSRQNWPLRIKVMLSVGIYNRKSICRHLKSNKNNLFNQNSCKKNFNTCKCNLEPYPPMMRENTIKSKKWRPLMKIKIKFQNRALSKMKRLAILLWISIVSRKKWALSRTSPSSLVAQQFNLSDKNQFNKILHTSTRKTCKCKFQMPWPAILTQLKIADWKVTTQPSFPLNLTISRLMKAVCLKVNLDQEYRQATAMKRWWTFPWASPQKLSSQNLLKLTAF